MMNSVEPPPMSTTRRGSSDGRQHVRDAVVDEPRLLVPADDVDREAQRALGLRQKLGGVGRDAKRVGRHRAHRRRVQRRDALAEAGETGERGTPGLGREAAVARRCRRRCAASRARCRAGRSGRLRRGRSPAGSCSIPCRRRRASWRSRMGARGIRARRKAVRASLTELSACERAPAFRGAGAFLLRSNAPSTLA